MAPPQWFQRALAAPSESGTVAVAGCPIRYLTWGRQGRPGLVFVHGGAAHAHWWSYLTPMFSQEWHVAALDLSGHGDSGRRDEYRLELWAEEVVAVAAAAGFPGPPVVVGHSLGGAVTITAAERHGDELAGAVVVDTPVRRPDPETQEGIGGRAFRHPGTYPTLEEALGRFRLVPDQPCLNPFIIDHIARFSLREIDAGWTWKFDPRVFQRSATPLSERLAAAGCRIGLFRGELSNLVPPEIADYMYGLLGRSSPVVAIPEAHHHVMLDQPLAFVAALRTLLADWEHSLPRRRTVP